MLTAGSLERLRLVLGSVVAVLVCAVAGRCWRRGARRASRMYRSGRMEKVEGEGKGGMSGWGGVEEGSAEGIVVYLVLVYVRECWTMSSG